MRARAHDVARRHAGHVHSSPSAGGGVGTTTESLQACSTFSQWIARSEARKETPPEASQSLSLRLTMFVAAGAKAHRTNCEARGLVCSRVFCALVRLALALVLSIGCGARAADRGPEDSMVRLREPGWNENARARLERAITELADRGGRRVAVFDWDNTMIRGDIGDLVLAHALERDRLIVPAWDELTLLTEAARAELRSSCRLAPGAPLPTEGGSSECARAIARIGWQGVIRSGEAAFTVPIAPSCRAGYAFLTQILAGHRDDDLRALAREAWARAESAPAGARAEVAGVELERFARFNAPMVELVHALEAAGVEVWIVSASAQPIVEELAGRIGIARERVIGVRTERDGDGRATARWVWMEETGPVIPWHVGKRRWIERRIGARPILAAGDSDGDLAMLQDAELRVVIDRHAIRLLCNALADPAHWIVQAPFHDPPAPRADPYPCSSHQDVLGAVVDPAGRPIPDQPPDPVDGS